MKSNKPYYIGEVLEGNNSVFFKTMNGFILYEKLANTIHLGNEEELYDLQKEVESTVYDLEFESDSLKKRKGEKLEALVLNVTESCNLSCSYCVYSGKYENERTENSLNMSFETAIKAVDKFMPLSKEITLVSFYGGEPLNNINLVIKVIDYVRNSYPKKVPAFSMTTNFCNVTDDIIKDIVKNEIYMNISLDGPREIHDKNRKFRGGKPTYDRIMENLRRLKEVSPEYAATHFSYSVTCKDPLDFPTIIRFFQENEQYKSARISRVEPKGLRMDLRREDTSDTFNFASEYLDLILSERDPKTLGKLFDQDLKNITIRSTEVMLKQLMLNGCCYPGNRKLFVDTDGTFYMCERFGRRLPIGNVDEGITQALIDEAINRFTQIRNDHCTKGCWAQRLCTPCIQSSKDPKGDISKEGLAYVCESNKSRILIALTNYVCLIKVNKKVFENYVELIQF